MVRSRAGGGSLGGRQTVASLRSRFTTIGSVGYSALALAALLVDAASWLRLPTVPHLAPVRGAASSSKPAFFRKMYWGWQQQRQHQRLSWHALHGQHWDQDGRSGHALCDPHSDHTCCALHHQGAECILSGVSSKPALVRCAFTALTRQRGISMTSKAVGGDTSGLGNILLVYPELLDNAHLVELAHHLVVTGASEAVLLCIASGTLHGDLTHDNLHTHGGAQPLYAETTLAYLKCNPSSLRNGGSRAQYH
jgi:hypothetical protein